MSSQIAAVSSMTLLSLLAACGGGSSDSDSDGTQSVTVAITSATCGNKTISYGDPQSGYAYNFTVSVAGTATATGMVSFFLEDDIYTLGSVDCGSWGPANGGCQHTGATSSINWTASQWEGDYTSIDLPKTITIKATTTGSGGTTILDSKQVVCGP
jgi:hypothetical protein